MKEIRKLVEYYRPHLPLFVVDFSCAFVMAGLELVFPIVVRFTVDNVIPKGDVRLLLWIVTGLLVLYLVRTAAKYIVEYWGHVLGTRMEYDMRRDLFNHIQKLSFTYFDNNKTGHIMSRIVNDLNEITEMAHHCPEELFVSAIIFSGSFIILLTLNWQLALITFILVPVMIVFAVRENSRMQAAFRDMRLKVADINAQVEDSISGVRVVKSFTNEDYERAKFDRGNSNFRQSKQNAYHVMARFFSSIGLMTNIINLSVLSFGSWFIFQGSLTVGELVGFLLYVSMFMQPVRSITFLVELYQKGMAGFNRFVETMAVHPDIVDRRGAQKLTRVKGHIRFNNVSFSYEHNRAVLKNINLEIEPGKTVALVGPSGAGKTTLCSLIPRFYEVEQGSITIDDIDIKNVTQKSLRANIGIVQQDVFIFTGTVRENIAYGRVDASDEEIIAAAEKANAHEFITQLENGYDTFIGERGVKLSGGQKQRIAIARVFLKNPPILILDEATSALDNETERIIQEALAQLSHNRTTLVIAHRLSTIRNADEILVLTDEGIVEQGSHEQLLAKGGLYARLHSGGEDLLK